jgi:hypothetical protein
MGLAHKADQPGGPGTPISRDVAVAAHEIARLSSRAEKAGMHVLTKTQAAWRSQFSKGLSSPTATPSTPLLASCQKVREGLNPGGRGFESHHPL